MFVPQHLSVKHLNVEDQHEVGAMLFVPRRAPDDMFETKNNIKLSVRCVFKMHTFDELIPELLYFVEGVVDSEDRLLNISRATLHQHNIERVTKKTLVKSCFAMFADSSKRRRDYMMFFEQFGDYLHLRCESGQDC